MTKYRPNLNDACPATISARWNYTGGLQVDGEDITPGGAVSGLVTQTPRYESTSIQVSTEQFKGCLSHYNLAYPKEDGKNYTISLGRDQVIECGYGRDTTIGWLFSISNRTPSPLNPSVIIIGEQLDAGGVTYSGTTATVDCPQNIFTIGSQIYLYGNDYVGVALQGIHEVTAADSDSFSFVMPTTNNDSPLIEGHVRYCIIYLDGLAGISNSIPFNGTCEIYFDGINFYLIANTGG